MQIPHATRKQPIPSGKSSKRHSTCGAKKQINSTPTVSRRSALATRATFCARRSQECFGRSSAITTTSEPGWRAILGSRLMHPNGQLPAYEWAFGDVNPPVHAWAAWRVYKIEKRVRGRADRSFLERVFHKLLLNFTWWVNRKDPDGMNVFQGGFLGLDNIGVFDRSQPLPTGGHLEQSDGTSWMGMYCLNMLAIALELARENPAYEDVASKFFEHFVYI